MLFRSDVCGPQLVAFLREKYPEIKESKAEGGRTFYTLGEAGLPLQPVAAVEGSALYLATSEAFLRECLARKSGLPQAPAYKQALAATAAEGNTIVYASPRLFTSLRGLFSSIPQLPGADRTFQVAVQSLMQRLARVDAPALSVLSNLPEGVLVQSVGPDSLRESLPVLGLATPDLPGNILRVVLPAHVADLRAQALVARQGESIRANLAKVSVAATAYFAANAEAEEVAFEQLRESAPELAKIAAVAGEDYSGLTVRRDRDSIELAAENGASATYGRPLTSAEQQKIEANLALYDEAASLYFAAKPDETSMSSSDACGVGLSESPTSVVGEQYDFSVERDAVTIELRTPGGTTVTYRRVPGLRWAVLKRRAQQTAEVCRQLALFYSVATDYLAAHPDESYVSGYELFGEGKERPELRPIAGESYSSVRLNRNSAEVSVEVPGLGPVVYEAELPAAQAAAIRENLRKLATDAAAYFRQHAEEQLVVAGELFATGTEKPTPVAGEDYESLVLERSATSLTLVLRNGRKVTVEKL